MMALLDTSEDLDVCADELGEGLEVGQLLSPLTRFAYRGGRYAIDNGAFAGLDVAAFRRLLDRQKVARDRCIFVACPDVVGSARRTLEVFSHWYPKLSGWPIALVIQDGIEDLPIPWPLISAVFIGGSTAFKLSTAAAQVIAAAKAMEKHVHVGRVNTPERFDKFLALGADSIDGSGISQYTHMRRQLANGHPRLEFAGTAEGDAVSADTPATGGAMSTIHEKLGRCHPKLTRNRVWCHNCGRTRAVDSVTCMAVGWPECCGETMSIDSPEERRALDGRKAKVKP